ncbi:MAG: arsenite methyltransferase [Candidatus Velamenicoccus archaeovorus]
MSDVREQVRRHYASAAEAVASEAGCGCGDGCCGAPPEARLYAPEALREVPQAASLASMGCGNPTVVAELREGEVVLDLGSGGGIDVILSARRVGPTGKAYGLDMTDEMLDLARRNVAEAGVGNVELLRGYIEDVPLPDASVDVVISNCVINLSGDKPAVFAEMARVLRPGGRIGIADIVAGDELTQAERAERGSWAGCIAGALSFAEYRDHLVRAGFEDVSITPTHEEAEGIFGAIVRATKPAI